MCGEARRPSCRPQAATRSLPGADGGGAQAWRTKYSGLENQTSLVATRPRVCLRRLVHRDAVPCGQAGRGCSVSEMEGGGRSDHECGEHREAVMEFTDAGAASFDNALSTFARLVSTRFGERAWTTTGSSGMSTEGSRSCSWRRPIPRRCEASTPNPWRSWEATRRSRRSPTKATCSIRRSPTTSPCRSWSTSQPGRRSLMAAGCRRRPEHRGAGLGWRVPLPGVPPVLAFHSIKGGVGRSSAVAVLAAHQAERGRNVAGRGS